MRQQTREEGMPVVDEGEEPGWDPVTDEDEDHDEELVGDDADGDWVDDVGYDTDGDGVVDTVVYDADGDGFVDYAMDDAGYDDLVFSDRGFDAAPTTSPGDGGGFDPGGGGAASDWESPAVAPAAPPAYAPVTAPADPPGAEPAGATPAPMPVPDTGEWGYAGAADLGRARPGLFRRLRERFRRDVAPAPEATTEVFTAMECPDVVAVGAIFDLVVGLVAEAPEPELEPIEVPPAFAFTTHVWAPGFEIVEGPAHHTIHVDLVEGLPVRTVRLRATETTPATSPIDVLYFVGTTAVGSMRRTVQIGPDRAHSPATTMQTHTQFASGAAIDVLLHVIRHPLRQGWLVNAFFNDIPDDLTSSPTHPPGRLIPIDDAGPWATTAINQLPRVTAVPDGRSLELRGVATTIADLLPAGFATELVAARDRLGHPPRVLCLTEDPHIPWELALVEWTDGDGVLRVELLGAMAAVGRWPIDTGQTGQIPPREEVAIHRLVAASAAADVLPFAASEVDELVERGAHRIDPDRAVVVRHLRREEPWDGLHLAVHGRNREGSEVDGLELVGGNVTGTTVGGARNLGPLVFLNACDVGGGQTKLGLWAGLPAAFVSNGTLAVVAPLWKVNDEAAKKVALTFYDTVSDLGPAEALRRCRATFDIDTDHDLSLTWLAYQYFGHPDLRLAIDLEATP